ncbi:MAG: hypothetical protein WC859_03285 [Elusimicrobiota bacterium]|jgi:hypothetical protein
MTQLAEQETAQEYDKYVISKTLYSFDEYGCKNKDHLFCFPGCGEQSHQEDFLIEVKVCAGMEPLDLAEALEQLIKYIKKGHGTHELFQ